MALDLQAAAHALARSITILDPEVGKRIMVADQPLAIKVLTEIEDVLRAPRVGDAVPKLVKPREGIPMSYSLENQFSVLYDEMLNRCVKGGHATGYIIMGGDSTPTPIKAICIIKAILLLSVSQDVARANACRTILLAYLHTGKHVDWEFDTRNPIFKKQLKSIENKETMKLAKMICDAISSKFDGDSEELLRMSKESIVPKEEDNYDEMRQSAIEAEPRHKDAGEMGNSTKVKSKRCD